MPINTKTFNNFIQLIKAKFNSVLPNVDPNINGGLAQAVSVSAAVAGYALQDVLQDAVNQSFIPTQNDQYLAISGSIENIPQLQPTASSGYVAIGGALNTIIPVLTNMSYLNFIFNPLQQATIQNYSGSIGLLTYSINGTVTATTNLAHSLSTGLSITITGATQTPLNGTYIVTVLSSTQFTYSINPNLVLSNDAGNYSATYALVSVQCTTTGSVTNVGAGSGLTLSVVGANTTGYVGIAGLNGGTDLETTANYRTRVLQGYNLTPGISTSPSEISSLKKIAGVTRIWIIPASVSPVQTNNNRGTAGYLPVLGETMIYIVNDNTNPITPTAPLIAACYNQVISDGLIPNWIPLNQSSASASNFWIIAPTLVTPYISIHLTANNTVSMQTAIQAQLVVFFQEYGNVGSPSYTSVSYKQLIGFIQNIQDPTTGLFVTGNFVFNGWGYSPNPTSQNDLPLSNGSLAIAGTIAGNTLIFN